MISRIRIIFWVTQFCWFVECWNDDSLLHQLIGCMMITLVFSLLVLVLPWSIVKWLIATPWIQDE